MLASTKACWPNPCDKMIEIDGSIGEGGGQIVRTALSLSSILKKKVRIYNIRAQRENPGLGMQHLVAARAIRSICRGKLENAFLGSKEIIFEPGEIIGGKYKFNITTAGSTTLLAQTLIPVLLFAKKPSELTLIGGTHVPKSPTYDYFEKIFLPAISMYGAKVKSKILKSGYYPRGNGEIKISIEPSELKGNEVWPSEEKIHAIIRLSSLPISIAYREKKILVENKIEDVKIFTENFDPGNSILIWKGFVGSSSVGEKSKRAEEVAQEAVKKFKEEMNEEVDSNLADQLLIYSSLAAGKSSYKVFKISEHTKTNAEVIKLFIDRKINLSENRVVVN